MIVGFGDRLTLFALIAGPDEYGDRGVMSFIVSHASIVYEQNLEPDGADVAEAMPVYDPDDDWVPAKEVSGPLASATQ